MTEHICDETCALPPAMNEMLLVLSELAVAFDHNLAGIFETEGQECLTLLVPYSEFSVSYFPNLGVFEIDQYVDELDQMTTLYEIPAIEPKLVAANFLSLLIREAIFKSISVE